MTGVFDMLNTSLSFETLDMRGRNGFANDPTGLVYVHREKRDLTRSYSSEKQTQRRTWVVRHRPCGWQVDLHSGFGIWEADPKLQGTFTSANQAAKALETRLDSQNSFEE